MNTEQVVEMIDAITEGKPYALKGNELTVVFGPEEIAFMVKGKQVFFEDPRIAREIAGGLIAWANRKEGKTGHYVLNPNINQILNEGN
jgi:hypothetical protein